MADSIDSKTIRIASENAELTYGVDENQQLILKSVSSGNGNWTSPLEGPVFPSIPYRPGKGPKYLSPLAIIAADGSTGIELLYASHSAEELAAGIEHLTITTRDTVLPLEVELHIQVYKELDVFEQWYVLKNGSSDPLQVPRLDSMNFRAKADEGLFLEWYESDEYHTAGVPIREKLNMGIRLLESRDGNRHKSGPVPAFVLGFGGMPDEDSVPCISASLEWIGSARFSFEMNNKKMLELSAGVNQPLAPVVEAGGSTCSPRMIYTFSAKGKGPASRNLHDWCRRHLLPGGDRLRPVDNNSWEGCFFNVDEASVIQMMEDSAGLGIELYVLDDGWFGNGDEARTGANAGLGDWQFNQERFPRELDNAMAAAKKLGIEFGIWFEPEMVNPKSKLFAAHPEWVLRNPSRDLEEERGQYVLDVANPDVQEHMFLAVHRVLAKYPAIRFVKWDCNANISNPYSPYLGTARQGSLLNEYSHGYLSVMNRLVDAHPTVDFQACAAGGGRSNYAAMRYSHTFWPSDATHPLYRLGAQWNFSTVFPALTITSHVTHAGGDEVTPKFRFDVSMMGQLGMEVDTRTCTPEYLASAKTGIAAYKAIRELVQQGDQFRHAHPEDSDTPSMNYVSKDRSRALLLAYQTGETEGTVKFTSPIGGLDPDALYQATEINLPEGDAQPRLANAGEKRSGSEWMLSGVPLQFSRQNDSGAVVLTIIEDSQEH
jgi:alpha-galactosidase